MKVLENMDKMLRRILGEDIELVIRRTPTSAGSGSIPSSIDQVS